jgi:hypothetical protein
MQIAFQIEQLHFQQIREGNLVDAQMYAHLNRIDFLSLQVSFFSCSDLTMGGCGRE